MIAQVASGIATAGVYMVLGILLAVGLVPLAIAGTAVLAIRSAQASLDNLLYAVNQCYEEGLYFSDYLAFCAEAPGGYRRQVPGRAGRVRPDHRGRVTFSYPDAAEPALHEVSVEIGRGEVVALVGENGSGKTTLAKILAGLYRPGTGAVYWDQTSLSDVDPEPMRELIAVIAQDHANWPLTVRHNIAMGRTANPGAAGRRGGGVRCRHRDREAGARLRHAAGPPVQRRRRAVRRPVAAHRRRARLLPVRAAADHGRAHRRTRRTGRDALFSSVRGHAKGRSVLLITHRMASVRHADRIYVLRDGRVIEQGRHAELMELRGQYAELYTLQAAQYG